MADGTPKWKASIGWVKPAPITKSIDYFFQLTPPDVNVVIATTTDAVKLTNSADFDPATFADSIGPMTELITEMQTYHEVDFVAATGDLVQCALGLRWNEAMREALQQASGRPAATAMTAAVDALREVGADRIAVSTPVTDARNAPVRTYLEEAGFEVLAIAGEQTTSSREIRGLPADAPYQAARRILEGAPGADAVYLPSLTWRATDYADRIEQEFGIPVVTLYNSFIWRALSAIGYDGRPMHGYGRLLASIGA